MADPELHGEILVTSPDLQNSLRSAGKEVDAKMKKSSCNRALRMDLGCGGNFKPDEGGSEV